MGFFVVGWLPGTVSRSGCAVIAGDEKNPGTTAEVYQPLAVLVTKARPTAAGAPGTRVRCWF
ncbi:hypothetical protein DIJ64_02250 [Mycobacterium leprae]|uniref:Uncharacterized protein n=1 Tax=Mycobacterium leprae TaxID=1769 RepID=A0AAD0KSW6_MYCLR|nr:hypothetical protein DIJ64_02250 [Mycobacterium leprae]OAR20591.1 hypothetical protein A8144_10150 [Mycobacterium leprae 3125609]OAX70797.1 hypothetical protein A3216_09915 [Mycobacterium leprae 7935681]